MWGHRCLHFQAQCQSFNLNLMISPSRHALKKAFLDPQRVGSAASAFSGTSQWSSFAHEEHGGFECGRV